MLILVKYDADYFIPFTNHSGDDVRGLELMQKEKRKSPVERGLFCQQQLAFTSELAAGIIRLRQTLPGITSSVGARR